MHNYQLTYPLTTNQFGVLYKGTLNSTPVIILRIKHIYANLLTINQTPPNSKYLSRIAQVIRSQDYLDLIIENNSGFKLVNIDLNEIQNIAFELYLAYQQLQQWDFITENIFASDSQLQKTQILDLGINQKYFKQMKDNHATVKILIDHYYPEWDPSIFFQESISKVYSLGMVLFAFLCSKDYLHQIKDLVQLQLLQNDSILQIQQSIHGFVLNHLQKHNISNQWQQLIIKLISNKLQWDRILHENVFQKGTIRKYPLGYQKKRMISLSSINNKSESTECSQKVEIQNESRINRSKLMKQRMSKSIQSFSKKNEFNLHVQTSISPLKAPINQHFFQSQKVKRQINFKQNFKQQQAQQQSSIIKQVENYLNDKKIMLSQQKQQQQYLVKQNIPQTNYCKHCNYLNNSTSLYNSISQNSENIDSKKYNEQAIQVAISKREIQIQTDISHHIKQNQQTQTEKVNEPKVEEIQIIPPTKQIEKEIEFPKNCHTDQSDNKSRSSLKLIVNDDELNLSPQNQVSPIKKISRGILLQSSQSQKNINHDFIYQQYVQNIENYSLIGDTIVKLLQRINALKNFWVIPLYLSFKCMFQIRVRILNLLLEQINVFDYPYFEQFRQSEQYQHLINKISNENSLIYDEMLQIGKVAKKKADELDSAKRSKIQWFLNEDLEKDYKRTNFIYLWCQIRPLILKEKGVDDLKLRFMLETSILLYENNLFDESHNKQLVQKILKSKNSETIMNGLRKNEEQLKEILIRYQQSGIKL